MKSLFKAFLNNKEAKNAGWIIGGRVAQMLLSLLIGTLSARYLGPSNYGLINYGNSFVAFFTAFCSLGINSVIIKDFIDHPHDQGKTMGTTLVLQFTSSLISVVMIMSLVSFIDNDDPLAIAVVFLCCIGAILHIFDSLRFWFQARYESRITSTAALIAYLLSSSYKIILLISGKDVRWFAFAASVDYIIVALFLFIAYKKAGGPRLSFSKDKAAYLLKLSYPYILAGAMVAVYGQTDKIMLKVLLNEAEVGYYAVATTLCGMWTFVLQAIIDSIYPTIISLYNKNSMIAYERKNRQLYAIVFYLSIFVSLMFVLFGEWAIGLLYGVAFLPAAASLKIVTCYTAFSYLGVARNAWVVSEGKQKFLTWIYLVSAVCNVILNFILIPKWGAIGAALASLFAQVSSTLVVPFFIKPLRRNSILILQAIFFKNTLN